MPEVRRDSATSEPVGDTSAPRSRRPYSAPVLSVESDIGHGTFKAGRNPEAHTAYSSTGTS